MLACFIVLFGCTQQGANAPVNPAPNANEGVGAQNQMPAEKPLPTPHQANTQTPENTEPAPGEQAPAETEPALGEQVPPAPPEGEPALGEQAPAEPEPANEASTASSLDKLYNYGSIKSFEYKITAKGAEPMSLKTTVSEDTVGGTAAWLTSTDMSSEGMSIIAKMWVDKTTQECLKTQTSMDIAGQKMDQEGQCPTQGSGSAPGSEISLVHVGKESVTVPAGTFDADKYTSEGIIYWASSDVPLPLKYETADGSVMELVAYS